MSLIDDELDMLNRLAAVARESSKRCKERAILSTQTINAALADAHAQRIKAEAYQDAYNILRKIRDDLRQKINELI